MKDILPVLSIKESDPFGLRKIDFRNRIPEKSEMFSKEEAETYIQGCDFPESADDLLLAWEVKERFGDLSHKKILDAMCGPGRLGRELMHLGANHVVFHDGDQTMITHAVMEASLTKGSHQHVESIVSQADTIHAPNGVFDLVVCHNSTHQMNSKERLGSVLAEFVRVTKPGGFVLIADFQRDTSGGFLKALEQRLMWTKPEIVPLLVPTFTAAFSKQEFEEILRSIPGIKRFQVVDAKLPTLDPRMRERVNLDPVKGHELDFSPISLRVIIQKEDV